MATPQQTPRYLRRATACAAVLVVGGAGSAVAHNPAVSTAPAPNGSSVTTSDIGRGGSPVSSVDRVADFYGSYIDVRYDSGPDPLNTSLRAHYLTHDLQHTLSRWEAVHHKDGVLRGNVTPVEWRVVYHDSGMGHCWSTVTLTWKSRGHHHTHHTRLMVQSDLATRLISDIREA
ncbi:hypothetical protein OKJ48_20975 [Streptomyces kunmingensis]|uniref:Uncharacterized protein n=1 Tax=Streptomyces kunmingensis TaxID=68225 RepID=A0ABU6CEZ8_9ACTN|nr:hypothetical protein [Streptomyces kunmingensis]MEB3962702.1 hypothetical protein [Streptomyces kunmingensis]